MLIERGEDVNVAAKNGRTALYSAVEMHDVDWSPRPAHKETDKATSMDIIHALLDHKANVNAQLTAPAPIEKHAQDMGDKTMGAGTTPFTRAARSADVELMHLLLDKGADPKLVGKDNQTALMVASGVAWTDHIKGTEAEALEAVKLCVSLGLDVNAATDKGETALHGAAHRGADTIAKYLVEKGANVNAHNKRGFTPLDLAMGKGGYNGALGPGAREHRRHDPSGGRPARPGDQRDRQGRIESLGESMSSVVEEDTVHRIGHVLRLILSGNFENR